MNCLATFLLFAGKDKKSTCVLDYAPNFVKQLIKRVILLHMYFLEFKLMIWSDPGLQTGKIIEYRPIYYLSFLKKRC